MILCLEVLVDYTESVDFWVYGRALKCTRSGPTWQNMLCDGYTARIRHIWCQKWDSLLESCDTYSPLSYLFIYFLRKYMGICYAIYPSLT